MSLPTVYEILELPAGVTTKQIRARLRLIALDDTDLNGAAYATAAPATVIAERETTPTGTGRYEFTNVRPTSGSSDDAIKTPANCVYELTIFGPGWRIEPRYLAVPDTAGPHEVSQVLSAAPSGLATPSSHQALTDRTTSGHPADIISLASSLVGTTATDVDQALVDIAPAAGLGRLITVVDAFGDSYGTLGASDTAHVFTRLLADQAHAKLRTFHAGGTDLTDAGNANTTQGGHIRVMGDAAPSSTYNKQSYVGRRGIFTICSGINGIQAYATAGDLAQFLACWEHVLRASISWEQLATFHAHDQASTGQTFAGSGSWSTSAWLSGFEEGPGTSRRINSSSGATYTIVTGANAAGRTLAVFLPANYTGGSRQASTIACTLDGSPATPIGWDSLDLSAVATASMGHGVCTVARFALPDDASGHTLVITAGTGGLSVAGYGIEAADPRTGLVLNTARRPAGTYTGEGSDANVAALNATKVSVVAEWGSPVRLVDIDTALAADTANFADTLHPNDRGHELVARACRAALDATTAATTAAKGIL